MLIAATVLAFANSVPQFDPIQLVERYRAYRLPEPPLEAAPVLCTDESTIQLPGFARAGKPTIVFRPWNACDTEPAGVGKVEPLEAARVKRIDYDDALWPIIAVLESRGDSLAANRILRAVFVDNRFPERENLSPWRPLRNAAWGYWRARAIGRPDERVADAAWLRTLSKIDGLQPSAAEKSFLRDLAAPPGRTVSNRFERLMEQTVNSQGEALSDQKYGPNMVDGVEPLAKPVVRIWEAGFDAVPTMFKYLDDRRITLSGENGDGASMWSGRNTAGYHRVCDLAADAITTALGVGPDYYSVDARESEGGQRSSTPDMQIAAVKAMWPKWLALKRRGELPVMLARLASYDEEERGALDTVSTDGARAYPLRVLARKYRSALVAFYRRCRFEHERDQIEEALADIKSCG